MLTPSSLQNSSDWDEQKPTIKIANSDPQWTDAYNNWKNGKNPTDSKEWKKGIFLTFTKAEDDWQYLEILSRM